MNDKIRNVCVNFAATTLALALSANLARAAELSYILPFSKGEYVDAHVRATSYSLPQDFVDAQWRLIMAPPEVLNYVVIHELAHLKFLNHSKKILGSCPRVLL